MIKKCISMWCVLAGLVGYLALVHGADTSSTTQPESRPQLSSGHSENQGLVNLEIFLPKSQYVTVVIEDIKGKRVRNLISETKLPAGKNTLIWDCYDDGEAKDGKFIRHRVPTGQYQARGLTHDGIKLIYEFPVYSGGNPPWATDDYKGGWLADHAPTEGATFIPSGSPYGGGKPQVLFTAFVAETGSPTVWVGTDGTTYQRRAVRGWDGALAAATDFGPQHDERYYAYGLTSWGEKKEVTFFAFNKATPGVSEGSSNIGNYMPKVSMPSPPRDVGLALSVNNGLAVATVPLDNVLVFWDVKTHKLLGTVEMREPKGVLLDNQNHLYVSTAKQVKKYNLKRVANVTPILDEGTVLVDGLEDPRTIQIDLAGKELYIADWGTSHQVKVYSLEGALQRTIGKPGGFQIGTYDELRMHQPCGLALDDKGQLWVAENDWLPKRVSRWDAKTGSLKQAWYGPPHYGGGGTIDPTDKTRLFYGEYGGTLEFKLDWEKGTSKLVAVPIRTWGVPKKFDLMPGDGTGSFGPEFPVHVQGHTYLMLGYQGFLRGSVNHAIWLYDDKSHTARPVCFVGNYFEWDLVRLASWCPQIIKKSGITDPEILNNAFWNQQFTFMNWTDLNADGKVTLDEIQAVKLPYTFTKKDGKKSMLFGFKIFYPNSDLSLSGSWGLQVPAPKIREDGTPIYDIGKSKCAIPPADDQHWELDGSDGLLLKSGIYVQGIWKGYKNNKLLWTYPATWENWTLPQYPGHVVEPTRLLGPAFTPGKGEVKDVIGMNGERGNFYLMTGDGLFIQTLAGHRALQPLFRFPEAKRGMDVSGHSFEDEHFHPTLTRTADGNVYIVAGKEHSSIFRLDGFENVKLQSFGSLAVTPANLAGLPSSQITVPRKQGHLSYTIPLLANAPVVDGKLEGEWKDAKWMDIGAAGKGALAISGDKLYAAWKTSNPKLLANGAQDPEFAFKRGGAVDLMVGNAGDRPEGRPIMGDMRLLICQVNGKNLAVLYRQIKSGPAIGKPVEYSSPIGKVDFEDVAVVTDKLEIAHNEGIVEVAIPLKLLNLSNTKGDAKIGDMGILRGEGGQTVLRSYWNNLDSAMVSDIPTEARLSPNHWGTWFIGAEPKK